MALISFCTLMITVILFYATVKTSYRTVQEDGTYKWDISTGSVIMFAAILIVVSTMRYGFIDTYAYRIMYELSRNNLEYVYSAPWGVESTWLYLLFLLNKISRDPQLMQFIAALIIIGAYVRTIRKYSRNTSLSLWIFFCLIYMSTNNGIRQYFASGICLLALPLFLKRAYVPYIATVVFASLFHRSAIFCLLIPLVASGKVLNKRMIAFMAMGIFFISFPNIANNYLTIIFSNSKYVEYFSSNKEGMSILRAMVTAVIPALLALLYIRQNRKRGRILDSKESLLINILFIDTVFVMMGTYMQYWDRVGIYFSVVPICLIPGMVRSVFAESNQKFIKIAIVVLYFIFFTYNIYCYSIGGDLNSFRIDI